MNIILLAACFSAVPLVLSRTPTKTLTVSNGGHWGVWGVAEYCPPGTYATGYIMKIEPDQFRGDDSALNAIKLTCSDLEGHVRGQVTSTEGPFGNWIPEQPCPQGTYLVNFQLQVEADQGSSDDSAANYVKFHCRDFPGHNVDTELVRPPGSGIWGKWGDWSQTCDQNSAICGLMTKVEGSQGSGDDTALNDVMFYCCSDTKVDVPVGR